MGELDTKNYYELLGVEKRASRDEIRSAYHAFALKHHPDNHTTSAPYKIKKATELFRRAAEGYKVLMNAPMRRRYDKGLIRGQNRYTSTDGVSGLSEREGATPKHEIKHSEARKYYEQGVAALGSDDLANAKLFLSIALRHAPQERLIRKAVLQLERAQKLKKRTTNNG